jgi:hypothetical protein
MRSTSLPPYLFLRVLLISLTVYVLSIFFILYMSYLMPLLSFVSSPLHSFLYLSSPTFHSPVVSLIVHFRLNVSLHFSVGPTSISAQVMWN